MIYLAGNIMKFLKGICLVLLTLLSLATSAQHNMYSDAVSTLRKQIMDEAAWAMQQVPVTVTATYSPTPQQFC